MVEREQRRALAAEAFRLLLRTGVRVTAEQLGAVLALDLSTVGRLLADLEGVGRVRRAATGEIVGILGLSVEPTPHEVTIDGALRWTWCAYDALGILGALAADGHIRSRSPADGASIELDLRAGRPPACEVVVFIADGPYASVVDDWCPLVNFFPSRRAAEEWATRHRRAGTTVPVDEAARKATERWRTALGMVGSA